MNKISVMVCNRKEAEHALLHDGMAVISIHTPGDEPADIRHPNDLVLHLCFSDISDPKLGTKLEIAAAENPGAIAMTMFSDQQARAVLDFVDAMMVRKITHFLIHCDAGLSRSPGVAVALNQIYNEDRNVPYRYQIFNTWVCNKILAAKNLVPFQRPEMFSM